MTSWAAIIAAPTFITGRRHEPALPGILPALGFAVALTLIVVSPVRLYFSFRRREWL